MPAGYRTNPEIGGKPIPAYLLPGGDCFNSLTGAGYHVCTDESLAALDAARAQAARDAQDEHAAKKGSVDPRWHKSEAKRHERQMRAYRMASDWLSGETRDLQAHRFPLEMADELDAAFRLNAIVVDQALAKINAVMAGGEG
jgi:hypothetical protein